jgi:signal transduction histidine kinase
LGKNFILENKFLQEAAGMIGRSANSLAIFSPLHDRRITLRFGLAVATAVLAVLLRALLDPALGHVAFYATVYMTVAFCATVAGMAPAALNAVLGFVGIFYWFVDPRHSLSIPRSEVHGVVGFFLVSAVLIALGVANRNKQLRLNATVSALTSEAAERQRAEQELQQAHRELEQRVQERTTELTQALARLKAEISVRERAEEQLRHLSVRLMALQDQERRRIARDLHDTTGQTLSAMKMNLAMIRDLSKGQPALLELLNDLDSLTNEALQEVRTTSYLLHPPLLDESGFASAARWFVDGFAKRSGIDVTCTVPPQLERPPAHCELVLFRVLQESLTNVHRHSGASTASVLLVHDDDHLTLEISDNGGGIPQDRLARLRESADHSGVGLAGMRERVRELGGEFEIRSDQRGTTISVRVPLASSSPAAQPIVRFSAV